MVKVWIQFLIVCRLNCQNIFYIVVVWDEGGIYDWCNSIYFWLRLFWCIFQDDYNVYICRFFFLYVLYNIYFDLFLVGIVNYLLQFCINGFCRMVYVV